jgi:CheY-like chemotaxis protein
MAKVLIAASPEPRAIVERVLAGHDLSCAGTIAEAERLLSEQTFDLILCTIAFDESKMFDLLRLAKSKPKWQAIPFVCARVRGYILRSPTASEAAAFTCRELGAAAFLDIANYGIEPERELRQAIEGLLGAGKATGRSEVQHG